MRTYTAEVITAFKQAQLLPAIVQVGNEITPGFLWPDGKIRRKGDAQTHWEEFSRLLKAGIAGVHDALESQDRLRTMIHIATGGERAKTKWFFDNLQSQGVEFDIIGLSYYPWWHGTLEELRTNLDITALDYGKDIMVVETAYPNRSDFSHRRGTWTPDRLAWPMIPEGQRAYLEALLSVVRATPNGKGLGVIWWYPESIPVTGAHIWFNGAMALFDGQGRVLPAAAEFGTSGVHEQTTN